MAKPHVPDFTVPKALLGHLGDINRVVELPGKNVVVTAGNDCSVHLYCTLTGERKKKLKKVKGSKEILGCVEGLAALTSDIIACGDNNRELRVLNVTHEQCNYIESFDRFSGSVLLARVNASLFVVSTGQQLLLYQHENGLQVRRVSTIPKAHLQRVVAIAANESKVITATRDGVAWVWAIDSKKLMDMPLTKLEPSQWKSPSPIISVAISGEYIYTGTRDGSLRVWNMSLFGKHWEAKISGSEVGSVAIVKSRNGGECNLGLCSTDDIVRLVDIAEGANLNEHASLQLKFPIRDAILLGDGNVAAVGGGRAALLTLPKMKSPLRCSTAAKGGKAGLAGAMNTTIVASPPVQPAQEPKHNDKSEPKVPDSSPTSGHTRQHVKRARPSSTSFSDTLLVLEKRGIDVRHIVTMKHVELATTLAYFLIAYDSDSEDNFSVLERSLQTVFKANAIAGDLLAGEGAMTTKDFCAMVAEQLASDKIACKGFLLRLQRFSAKVDLISPDRPLKKEKE